MLCKQLKSCTDYDSYYDSRFGKLATGAGVKISLSNFTPSVNILPPPPCHLISAWKTKIIREVEKVFCSSFGKRRMNIHHVKHRMSASFHCPDEAKDGATASDDNDDDVNRETQMTN